MTAFKFAIFAAALLGISIILFLAVDQNQNTVIDAKAARVLLSGLNLIIAVVLVVMATTLVLWLCRRLAPLFGTTTGTRLAGLAVAAYLFPNTAYALVIQPIRFVMEVTLKVSAGLAVSGPGKESGELLPVNEVLLSVTERLQAALSQSVSALEKLAVSTVRADHALALIFAALVGQALSAPTGASSSPVSRAMSFVNGMKPADKRLAFLFSVLLLATYLSVVSVVAVPWMEQAANGNETSAQTLRLRLEDAFAADSFDKKFPADFVTKKANPFEILAAKLNPQSPTKKPPLVTAQAEETKISLPTQGEKASTTPGTATPPMKPAVSPPDRAERPRLTITPEARLSSFRSALSRQEELRDSVTSQWQLMRENAIDYQPRLLKNVVSTFETNMLSPRSRSERVAYFQAMAATYEREISNMHARLSEFKSDVENADRRWREWAAFLASAMDRQDDDLPPYFLDPTSQIDLDRYWNFDPNKLPIPATPGIGWGAIGGLASWLLATESVPLTQIVGMLGFGLLGAVIAAFLRHKSTVTPPFAEAVGVMVSGFSAALILFLGIKGGLTAFANDAEPNSYVIFFLSLVGAYYSEDVWTWAHQTFASQYNGTGKPSGGAGGTGQGGATPGGGSTGSPPATGPTGSSGGTGQSGATQGGGSTGSPPATGPTGSSGGTGQAGSTELPDGDTPG